MDTFENNIRKSLNNDKLPFEADPSILQKLACEMAKKSLNSAPRMNSIFPLHGSFFKGKFLVLKVAATILLIFSVLGGVNQFNVGNPNYLVSDSAHVMVSDTTLTPLMSDSLPF